MKLLNKKNGFNFPRLTVVFVFWVQWVALSPHSKVLGTNPFGPDVNGRVHADIQDEPWLVPEDRWDVGSAPGKSVRETR